MRKNYIKGEAFVLSILLIMLFGVNSVSAENNPVMLEKSITRIDYENIYNYKDYTGEDIIIDATSYSSFDIQPEIKVNYEGDNGKSVLTGEEGFLEWTVDIIENAKFSLMVSYFPISGKGSSIEREIYIDNKLPFKEARSVLFSRVWADNELNGQTIIQDKNGNDIRPTQIEKPKWIETIVIDSAGYAVNGLNFCLSAGKHTIRLSSVKEPMLIKCLKLVKPQMLKKYSLVQNEYSSIKKANGETILIRAEIPAFKSDPTLAPIFDRSSIEVEPNDPVKLRLNCIGGNKWDKSGQWIEWNFNVKETGLYYISLRAIQNLQNGSYTNRKIYIDGKIPFEELNGVKFVYSEQWKIKTLGEDKNPYLFYLTKGSHTIRMEATLADMADIVSRVEKITNELNGIYRNILILTGPSPDIYRDYKFDKIMPDVIENMSIQARELNECFAIISNKSGMKGETAQILRKLSDQLNEMVKKPETIANRFSAFQSNISSLGTWTLIAKQQPLSVDAIYIIPANNEIPKTKSNFWNDLLFQTKSFIASFYNDYNSIASSDSKGAVMVWVGSGLTGGRDQAQVLNNMTKNYFTSKNNIEINLQLVSMGALLPATLSGKGPDVALSLGAPDAVNYAIRNAVVNLAQFSDYKDVASRFSESALTPLSFNGKVYGLPETQTFPMLFYRKDILSELKLGVPETWDDVIEMLPVLQKKQMNFGLPSTTTIGNGGVFHTFTMLLYQSNGELYSAGGKNTQIDSDAGAKSFNFLTKLYYDYQLPITLDFVTRFRTGAIPIGIGDYSLYNQLSVFAPELNGLWDFTMVPGTKQTDGSINRLVYGSVSTSVMMSGTKNKKNAWEFLKWWTSANTQVQFGQELESILGTAARYPTANKEALYQIPWSKKNFDNLMKQWQYVKGIPEVPGGYYTARNIDFAFRNTVYDQKNAIEELTEAAKAINKEIKVKRKEFGLKD